MKHIQAIGFDMDYTLVRYNSEAFEAMTYEEIKKKLLSTKKYPAIVKSLKFDYSRIIRGLVIDKPHGNVLKLSLHSKVKQSRHGGKELDFKTQQKIYQGLSVDLNDSGRFAIVDTSFSIAYACLLMQIVDLKNADDKLALPDFKQIEADLIEALDTSHRDGSLKSEVKKDVKKYIVQDPEAVAVLESFKKFGKKLWVITNSDYEYSKLLLDYTITPFLKKNQHWTDLFDLVITSATKPRFFTDRLSFLSVDLKTGMLKNHHGPVTKGVYQGGCAQTLQKDHGLSGEQILYLGDHIYGDILTLKKTCNWRTALVVEELEGEREALKATKETGVEINALMNRKIDLEHDLDRLHESRDKKKSQPLFDEIEGIDKKLGKLIREYQKHFNPHWGEVMRAGVEPSRFAGQVEKYACIYMSKIADFADYSPRTYYRPKKRPLPHEME
ncbi:MAG: HAD-IG family 5'-nucleotidase [Bacteriovoracaceae bacterium]|nr:HAD-IG family 5'-nucleotidase [Bacteriovoracaceae bacterium]